MLLFFLVETVPQVALGNFHIRILFATNQLKVSFYFVIHMDMLGTRIWM